MTGSATANLPGPLRVIDAARQWLNRVPFSLVQLFMRIAVGSVFFNAGLLKYRSWEVTLLLFRDEYKVPLLNPALAARMATFNELTFSTLLFLGWPRGWRRCRSST